ncbi:MAG: hypothetical protein P8182_20200 [Deltaproteobacteria bacterium]
MSDRCGPFSAMGVLCVVAVVCLTATSWAKVPDAFRGIKLGMQKAEVLRILEKNPAHFSYDDMGGQIGEIVRGDKLFRYATYRFDSQGKLMEIGLEMREIIGRDRVLKMYNSQHGLKVSPSKHLVEHDCLIEVRGNELIMRKMSSMESRAGGQAR